MAVILAALALVLAGCAGRGGERAGSSGGNRSAAQGGGEGGSEPARLYGEFREGCSVSGDLRCRGEVAADGRVTLHFTPLGVERERYVFAGQVKDCEFTAEETRLIREGQEIDCDVRLAQAFSAQCPAEASSLAGPVVLRCPALEKGKRYVVDFKVITFTSVPIEGAPCARQPEGGFKCYADGRLMALAR